MIYRSWKLVAATVTCWLFIWELSSPGPSNSLKDVIKMLRFGSIASLRHKNDLQQVITSILVFSSAEDELLLSWRSQESSRLKKGEEEYYAFEKF